MINYMKKFFFLLLVLFFSYSVSYSQDDDMGQKLQNIGQSYAIKYLEPFTTGIGMNLNSGFLGGFKPGGYSKIPIMPHVWAGIKFCGVVMEDKDKMFNLSYNDKIKVRNPITGQEQYVDATFQVLNAPTVFGDTKPAVATASYTNPYTGQQETKQQEIVGGLGDSKFVFLFIPQVGVGTILGTDLILRMVPGISVGNYGSFMLFGGSIRHNLGGWIKNMPLDIAVQLGYQNFGIKNNNDAKIISANTMFAGIQFYKTFPIISVYGGVQYENYSVDVNYNYTFNGIKNSISFNQKGDNSFRFIGGATITVGPVMFNADANFGSKFVLTTGLGVGF